jgi:hypothetical protein
VHQPVLAIVIRSTPIPCEHERGHVEMSLTGTALQTLRECFGRTGHAAPYRAFVDGCVC